MDIWNIHEYSPDLLMDLSSHQVTKLACSSHAPPCAAACPFCLAGRPPGFGTQEKSRKNVGKKVEDPSFPYPDALCMVYLPTFG